MITLENIMQLACDLEGTCASLETRLDELFGIELDDIPYDLLVALDERVMLCECCGWWVESADIDDDSICSECRK